MWLAPNLITLVGFIINIIPHIYLIYEYGWSLDGEISDNMCYALGLCYGIYMWLDNCDGKQARRTGNSSPLGMIFDH
jgi:ethanolaminephosphotransferase